jgi:glycosyltransferase involved in cell wall biosynthesis
MNDSKKLPLSVYIIAHNEEANLLRCLRSVQGWVNEMVVVTNDCTDRTAEVAGAFGARVMEHPWVDFRAQKNFALQQCASEWALNLDADEEVSRALRAAIGAFLLHPGSAVAASFPRKCRLFNRWIRHGDWYPDRSLRLSRRGRASWEGDAVHTRLGIKGSVCRLKEDLLHYPYASIHVHVTRLERYADLFAIEQVRAGKRWSVWSAMTRPLWRFFRAYVLRLGWLDGYAGFYIAAMTAYYTHLRYAKWREREVTAPPGETGE